MVSYIRIQHKRRKSRRSYETEIRVPWGCASGLLYCGVRLPNYDPSQGVAAVCVTCSAAWGSRRGEAIDAAIGAALGIAEEL